MKRGRKETSGQPTLDAWIKRRKRPESPPARPRGNNELLDQYMGRRGGGVMSRGCYARMANKRLHLEAKGVDGGDGGYEDVAWDKYGKLALTAGRKGGISVIDDGAEVLSAQTQKSIECCVWDATDDAKCVVGFSHNNEAWSVDLESCDESNPTPVMRLTTSSQGINAVISPSSVVYGSGRDGVVYQWDQRVGSAPVGTLHDTGYVSRGTSMSLFTTTKLRSRPTEVNTARRAPVISPPSTAVHLSGNTLFAGFSNGKVSIADVRQLKKGFLQSANALSSQLKDVDGNEVYGMPGLVKASVSWVRPSPYLYGAVLCLLTTGVLVEIDVLQQVAVRMYVPHVAAEDDDDLMGTEPVVEARSAAYLTDLSMIAVPTISGISFVPWSSTRFGKWTTSDGSTFCTSSSGMVPIYTAPTPSVCGIAPNPLEPSLLTSTSSGLFAVRYLP